PGVSGGAQGCPGVPGGTGRGCGGRSGGEGAGRAPADAADASKSGGGPGPAGERAGRGGGERKRAGPWGGDGPARGGVSTITLRKGCRAHCRRTTTLRNRSATPRCPRKAPFITSSWPKSAGKQRKT